MDASPTPVCPSCSLCLHPLIAMVSRDISPTSKMRTEIRMRSGHLFWAKHRQGSEVVDLQALFNEYWGSTKRDFTVPSQSSPPQPSSLISDRRAEVVVIRKYRWSLELRFSINTTVRIHAPAHQDLLTVFA